MNIIKKIGNFTKNNKIELRAFFCVVIAVLLTISINIFTNTYSKIDNIPTEKSNSRIEGKTVYVDDLLADYHHYKGLNHTEIRSTSIPSGNSTGYYDNDYLVKVTIIYDGKDINNSSLIGEVSPINNENANKYIYYKYYALERNSNGTLATDSNNHNYIRIELIDNPFSKRPYVNSTEYGFNGWVCNQEDDTTANLCEKTTMDFDTDDYTRHMDIPISDESEITVHLNASWYKADVVTSSDNINDFNSMSMQKAATVTYTSETQTGYAYWNATYYTMNLTNTYRNREYMYSGYYYKTSTTSTTYTYVTRTTRCPRNTTCYVYRAVNNVITEDSQYTGGSVEFVPNYRANSSLTTTTINTYDSNYMNFVQNPNGTFTATVQVPHYHSYFSEGDNTSGFYYQVSNPTTTMISTGKYYNVNGEKCTSTSECTTAYKLIQSNDDTNNSNGHSISVAETINGNDIDADKYYYLVTRDTNIFRYTSATALTLSNLEVDKPFTITGTTVTGTSPSGVLEYPSTSGWFGGTTYYDFEVKNDLVIENIKINGPDTSGTDNTALGGDSKTSQVIYANSHNLKIGRNVTNSDEDDYLIAQSIFGGTNSSVSGTFKVIIESGIYYAYHSGVMSSYSDDNFTLNETTILGSDYDRASPNNNKLKFIIGLDGYAGGHHTAGSDSPFASFTIVKSGTLGYNSDGTPNTDNTAGMYIGGRASTCVNSITGVKIEGGNINTIVGGYGYNGSTTTNSTYIGMSGGTVRAIYGGAGHSTTKGNRIINVTGGTVSYSILGGSDSYSSEDTDDGVVQGSTLVYAGGTVLVGDGSTDELNGVQSGNVFGAGGGNSNPDATSKGTVYNSHVIINGGTITDAVYGGGNFGSTGTQNDAASKTLIEVYTGKVGNVYGGSKSAGFGKSNYASTSTIDINVTGGTIGNIYGGSNDKGTIYGSTDINIAGGTITGNVYGGGRGSETTVTNNVNVTIGTTGGDNKPSIGGSVYGGSALGTVNGSSGCTTVSSYNTHVVVNSGNNANVFGGGQGDDSDTLPYVCGNVTVDVNGGTTTNVFGGNDLKGTPNGKVTVNINDGTVTSAYAGGNQTKVSEPYINVKGGTVTNAFGGGNNATVTTSHISVSGGTVTNAYGGGNNAGATTSNLSLIGGTVTNAYGGGNNAGVTTTNVNLNGSNCTNVFGGSNASGTVTTSNVTCTSGTATSVYGGNNLGGTTATTNVTINGGKITNAYGGGESTDVTVKTNITLNGSVTNMYGGSNSQGIVETTDVKVNGTATNVFGGNNLGGTSKTTLVTVSGGIADSIYGGGNQAETTTSTINFQAGTSKNVYGGGNKAGVTTTNVNLGKGSITNVFGGSNTSGDVTTSNVKNLSSSTTNPSGLTVTTSFTTSNINNSGATDIVSSETINATINNTTGANIVKWDLYLITSDAILDSNWSSATITKENNAFHINEINQYYGTNTISAGGNYQFNFNIHSSVEYEDFKIYGYIIKGYDTDGNEYKTVEYSDLYATNIFGGNNQGGTTSTTNVTLSRGNIDNVYGGGEKAATNLTNVSISGATINKTVYGGGDNAKVNTNTNVEIKNNSNILGTVYGGGNAGVVDGNTKVFINSSNVEKNVYGGGNKAAVSGTTTVNVMNKSTIGNNLYGGGNSGTVAGVITVGINDSTIEQNVYGGGNLADVSSNTNITIENKSSILGNVFGGGNEGKALNNTIITINQSNISKTVYGGGNKADVKGKTSVSVTNGSVISESVFGGGNEGKALNNTNVIISQSNISKTVYGGGNKANVEGNTDVDILNSSTIQENIYGGGNEGKVLGNTNVNIDSSTITNNTFGGGNKATVKGNTTVALSTSSTNNVYGGGNEANVEGDTNVTLNGATIIENAFGGGNNGKVYGDTSTLIHNTNIGQSAFAGGNGATASVYGNNTIDVDGTTTITRHLFGGGNAAETGCSSEVFNDENTICTANSSTSKVNVAGATIGGNVYGGANTSVVYGETFVNVGINTIEDDLTKGNIDISGTIFGGGEANASGSEDYDFNFISVTEGINIHIDASEHTTFDIDGSIFGSGNASSSGGYSYVNIDNYGTITSPKNNVSIQRADIVTLNNSAIKLSGAQDRTNKYKNELFTLSRIGHLKLKNNSSLFLEKGANLLEKYSSLVDIEGQEHEATVTINENNGNVTKNVDNRIYMIEGKNLNISDDESLATYGDVIGMTFFGMFKIDRNGNIATGRYASNYKSGDTISGSEQYYFSSGSYVVGKHKSSHDIKVDGFYSNFPSEDGTKIVVDYIEPTPSDATYYRWVIGESVESLEVNLTASKYSTLGTVELQLRDYYHPNTEINILGVNFDNLSSDINLLDPDDIPRHASSTDNANSNFGLAIKTGNTGWITKGETSFQTVGSDITGITTYKAENSNAIPSFIFYLYHSKNITEAKDLGTATISLMVATPIDDLSNKIQRINIEVNMSTVLYKGDNYEGAVTPGEQYKMFANSNVNITSKSTFSTYFSLYSESNTNIYKTGYHRSLVSSYALPENTKITMIDFASSSNPEYYYYIIDHDTYQNNIQDLTNDGEVSYNLSNFTKMGSSSTNNKYDDAVANTKYYDNDANKAEEEFIFIIDLKDTTLNQDVLEKSILLELRDSNDNPQIPVLDISQQKMFYNLYANKEAILSSQATLSNDSLYIGKSTDLNVITSFNQQTVGNTTIIDTNYYEKRLGIKLSLYNSENQLVNGASLLGTTFKYNKVSYFPRQDGTVRFNIAESVANVSSKITIDTASSNLPSGEYKLIVETFGSSDGIYYGTSKTTKIEKNLTIVNEIFGLNATLPDIDIITDKNTGLQEDKNNYLDFNLQYTSGLKNPSIRVSMYRRTYDEVYDYTYKLIDIQDYITNTLTPTNESKVYLIRDLPNNNFQFIMNMKPNLKTGTYQIRFNLYDKNNYVGHINKYIIIE